jgi:hypothetical protein
MKLAAIILLSSWTLLAQQPGPSVEEQQDLMRAVNEGTSPVDLIRGLEAHLAKYPNSSQRLDIERSLAKAAIDDNDVPRIAKYGESAVATSSADFQLLDRLRLSDSRGRRKRR